MFIAGLTTRRASCALVLSLAIVTTTAWAAPPLRIDPGLPPVPWTQPTAAERAVAPLSTVDLLTLPALDLAALAVEDGQRAAQGLAPRYAIPNPTLVSPLGRGTWESLDDETSLWRLRIGSPGAVSINLGIGRYKMPPGGRLFIYDATMTHVLRAFTDRDNAEHGELWTPPVEGDEIVVEVTLPTAAIGALSLDLTSINLGYRRFGDIFDAEGPVARSGACNVDVVCPEGDDWRNEIPAVAVISTGGSTFCTGFMVNNAAQDLRPYFMTANHCGVNSGNAASLVVFWNYQNSTCRPVGSPASGGAGDGSLTQFNTGSTFRAAYSTSDFTLVELTAAPDPAWSISYAGWSKDLGEATSGTCIHHPNTDEKRITFYNTPTTTTGYNNPTPVVGGSHVHATWSLGVTEPGSSGSPLFDQNHRVIGQLHGGPSACGASDLSDYYGRISTSWAGGGTSATRLSDWLDPANTGTITVDTISGGGLSVAPAGTVLSIGVVGGPFDPATTVYTVSNPTRDPANYQIALGGGTAPLLINGGAGPLSGTLNPTESVVVTVTFDATASALAAGLYSTDVVFTDLTNNLVAIRTHQLEIGQTAFTTVPANGLFTGGPVGGPFNATQVYTMTSTRPTPVTVRVSADQPWVSLNGGPGPVDLPLSGMGATADVTVGIGAAANALPAGLANASVTITNLSGGSGDATRPVVLDVGRFSYSTTNVPQTINNNSTITATINVTDIYCVGDVNIPIDILHTYIGDLNVDVMSPQGTIVRLHARTGSSTDDLILTYDDGVTNPDGPGTLSNFVGEPVNGVWTLTVIDAAGGDTGTLQNWSLKIASAGASCPTRTVIYDFPLDTNPGWTADADWAFGHPTGTGGDPANGYTGTNVYGYNLGGQYPNGLTPVRNLTTTALDLRGVTGARLEFRRWLGVESSSYDHATVQVSNDGTNWTTLWSNPSTSLNDAAWAAQTIDLSATADNQQTVYIRWTMGTTDGSLTYCGWNIDDVRITGIQADPCNGVLRGDVSADGLINGRDIQPFVTVALNPVGATQAQRCAADVNISGTVTTDDIAPFVTLLLTP